MRIKPFIIIGLLVITHVVVALVAYRWQSSTYRDTFVMPEQKTTRIDKVLDGDTVVVDGTAIRIRGMDTPELGPWAHCWAEALAARESMETLEGELRSHEYKIVDHVTDKDGKVSARFVTEGIYDITDAMRVSGGAALTDKRWDWCGTSVKLHDGTGESPRYPHLWWPSNDVYDARAAD